MSPANDDNAADLASSLRGCASGDPDALAVIYDRTNAVVFRLCLAIRGERAGAERAMVETYRDMTEQVGKERVAFERLWAQREKQAQRLMLGTANIIGSMQGHIGPASMPRIKGLELPEELE